MKALIYNRLEAIVIQAYKTFLQGPLYPHIIAR